MIPRIWYVDTSSVPLKNFKENPTVFHSFVAFKSYEPSGQTQSHGPGTRTHNSDEAVASSPAVARHLNLSSPGPCEVTVRVTLQSDARWTRCRESSRTSAPASSTHVSLTWRRCGRRRRHCRDSVFPGTRSHCGEAERLSSRHDSLVESPEQQ